jgi:hypothetical protein
LLSNVMLDDLDRSLFERGHRFVRYADDVRVFVRSKRAGLRVLDSVARFVEDRRRLKVNRDKSWVRPAQAATLLGFGFYVTRDGVRVRVAPEAIARLKQRLRELTSRRWRISMDDRIDRLNRYITRWMAYILLADTPTLFADLDQWLHRRMRQIRWKEGKLPTTTRRNLRRLGAPPKSADRWGTSSKGYWRIAGSPVLQRALPRRYWGALGLRALSESWNRFRTA